MGTVWNPNTRRYESNGTAPARGYTKTAVKGGRGGKPKIDPAAAAAGGWQNVYSPNRAESAGAREGQTAAGVVPAGEMDWAGLYKQLTGGGSSGPTTAQQRAGGLQAAKILERAGRQGQAMYGQQADELTQQLGGIYNPFYSQQEQFIGDQQKRAMDFLAAQYGGNQQAIQQATAAALQAIPTSAAYQNVPIVNLQQEQNPLLAALGAYGASGEAATAQSAADAQMAQQLADLVKGSAGQMSTAQQAVLDAAKFDVTAGGQSALQQLALAKQAQEAGITSEQQRAMSELAGAKVGSQAEIAAARQGLLSQGIESLLEGLRGGATQRAETIAKYGPSPKKPKTGAKNKGGKVKGKSKTGRK